MCLVILKIYINKVLHHCKERASILTAAVSASRTPSSMSNASLEFIRTMLQNDAGMITTKRHQYHLVHLIVPRANNAAE